MTESQEGIYMNNADQYMEALTKREWYTGQALTGMFTFGIAPEIVAQRAVAIADAVLAELAKEKV